MKFKIVFIAVIIIAGAGLTALAVKHFGNRDAAGIKSQSENKQKELKHEGEHEDKEKGHGKSKTVKLHDEELKEFGIEIRKAAPGKLTIPLELPGEIVLNADRLTHIVSRIPGVVRKVFKNRGDLVQAGEVLALIDSRELADAKAAYLAAFKRVEIARLNLKREEELWKKRISPEIDFLEAKKVLAETEIEQGSAEQKLHALDLSDEAISQLPSQPDISFTKYEIKAPLGGTVIEKHITLGEMVKDDKDIFSIADLSSVWVNIHIYQKDMNRFRKG
jgi:cobalt-zinc-cadmium efflux system membrane fusion protein